MSILLFYYYEELALVHPFFPQPCSQSFGSSIRVEHHTAVSSKVKDLMQIFGIHRPSIILSIHLRLWSDYPNTSPKRDSGTTLRCQQNFKIIINKLERLIISHRNSTYVVPLICMTFMIQSAWK